MIMVTINNLFIFFILHKYCIETLKLNLLHKMRVRVVQGIVGRLCECGQSCKFGAV